MNIRRESRWMLLILWLRLVRIRGRDKLVGGTWFLYDISLGYLLHSLFLNLLMKVLNLRIVGRRLILMNNDSLPLP